MNLTMLKSKIHRATVTDADLNYEGSISIDPVLIKAANFHEFEQVDIYNCNNGARFHTYVIVGKPGDVVIIACYAQLDEKEAKGHEPKVVFVNAKNKIKKLTKRG
jgi:aspartate 1-decarboxylase